MSKRIKEIKNYLSMAGDDDNSLQRTVHYGNKATICVLLDILDELAAIRKHLTGAAESEPAEWQILARDPSQKIAAIKAAREAGMEFEEAKAKVEDYAAGCERI